MIKLLQLSEDKQKKIVAWLTEEIKFALQSRSGLEDKWTKWQRQFEAKPDTENKNFPFEKASNIVVPIQSITVNAFVARQFNTIISSDPFWTVRALSQSWTDHAIPTQRLLDYAKRFEMKMNINCIPWFYDMANLGTAVAKHPWVSETGMGKRYDVNGSVESYAYEIADGPRFIPVPLSDFIVPVSSIQDIQTCAWIAHRFRLRWPTIKRRGKQKIYVNTDKIEKFYKSEADNLTEAQERLEHIERAENTKEWEIFEVWCDYDYDDCGYDEKCVFTISLDAGVIVRPILNPFNHGKRPFTVTPCFPRAHRLYGIGFGQKLERLQEGITTSANQSIDNASIANMKCFKTRKGSGVKPGTKLYTGKIFTLADMQDLDTFSLGELNPNITLIINFLRDISERETGVSDYSLGKESSVVKTGATATSTLALIQEGTKLFDFVLQSIRNSLNEVAYQTYTLYSQFKPSGLVFTLLGQDSDLIEETWQAKDEDVRRSLLFELTASSANVNKAVERESWLSLFTILSGYYEKLLNVVQMVFDPAAPPALRVLAGKIAESGHLIMQRIVARWDILDADRILVDFAPFIGQMNQEMQMMQQQAMQQQGIMIGGGGGGVKPPAA